MHFTLTIFADYFQVNLEDEKTADILSLNNNFDLRKDVYEQERVVVALGVIALVTARNMDVPVEVEISASEPKDSFDRWDQVVDCGIDVESGTLLLAGVTDDRDKSSRFGIDPGSYRARVFFGQLGTVSPNGLEGDDYYRIVLWPGRFNGVSVLKQYTLPSEQHMPHSRDQR